ncbi:MAG: flagellar biosynthetic protein FliR [Desulfobulbaceae bacterium]|nr:flagellar biosynthetic protein FliR [Desulfobulbaceae bacterium]
MDIQLVPIEQFQNFLLCFARVMSIIAAIPVFNTRQAPVQVKIGLGFGTALLLFPLMAPYTPEVDFRLVDFGLIMTNEMLIGLMIGLSAQLIFTAVGFGGTIIGYQMGFAAANVFDPQTTQQLSLMSQFQNVLAILIFLALDIHHIFFNAIIDSYILLPPGYLDFSGGAVPLLMQLSSHMFVLGVKFSAPVLALLLISNMVLGILARVFPQLNVFMLSFPMNIGLAFFVIGLTLNATLMILRREFDTMGSNFLHFFQLLN